MDLMFDAQVLANRHPGGELPESVLDSIARYYRRAVTESRPMSHLIAVVMLVLLGALGFRAVRDAYGAQCRSTRRPFWQPNRPDSPGTVHLA
jgi:uncharacterized BrkB/YihY/UPF0761 family membrane protein